MSTKHYLVIESNDAGSACMYQTKTAHWKSLPNQLEASDMTVIELPRCLEDGLGFEVIKQQWRLTTSKNSATATMRPAQIDDLIEWINRVIAAINGEVA